MRRIRWDFAPRVVPAMPIVEVGTEEPFVGGWPRVFFRADARVGSVDGDRVVDGVDDGLKRDVDAMRERIIAERDGTFSR